MKNKTWQTTTLMFIILVVIGGAIAGSVMEKTYILINDECLDEIDNNNDGDEDIYEDLGCSTYPYEDGDGETPTPFSNRWQSDIEDYQTGYDLWADIVHREVAKCPNGDASACGIPRVNNDVDFFCMIESNANTKPSQYVQVWAQSTGYDDGSYQMIQDLCYQFGGSGLSELPVLNYQQYAN